MSIEEQYQNLVASAKELKSQTSYHGGMLKIVIEDYVIILHYINKNGIFILSSKEEFIEILQTVYN